MNGFVKLLLALVALGVLGYFCIYQHAPAIAAAIDSGVGDALETPGTASAVVWATDGRDVTLTGNVANDAERDRVIAAVAAVPGVRVINDQLVLAELPTPPLPQPEPPYRTRLELTNDAAVTISGDVPNGAAREALIAAAGSALPGRSVVDGSVLRATDDPAWRGRNEAALAALGQMTKGYAELEDDTLTVRGEVASAGLLAAVNDALGQLEGATLAVDVAVVAPSRAVQEQAVVDCQQRFDAALSDSRILFATGSADIDSASDALLAELAGIARACPLARIDIGGHTDSTGDAAYNEYLSGQRANAVRDNLIARGVAGSRLTATGYGPSQPVADNATRAGRERNRRIEMRVTLAE